MNVDLYEWVRGPLMSATVVFFIVGLALRVQQQKVVDALRRRRCQSGVAGRGNAECRERGVR